MASSYTPTASSTSPLAQVPLAAAPAARAAAPSESAGPDPLLVQETKNEIRALVHEIAKLAQQEILPEEFYAGFLGRIVSAMASVGGAVWTSGDNGLTLKYQVNLAGAGLDDTAQARE